MPERSLTVGPVNKLEIRLARSEIEESFPDNDETSASACDFARAADVATFDRNAINSLVGRCSLTPRDSSPQLVSAPPSATDNRSASITGSFAALLFSAKVQRSVSDGSGGS